MIHYIYIIGVILITISIIIYYFIEKNNHDEEMKKIFLLETLEKKRKNELEQARSQTTPCLAGNFDDPRSCYIGSDYNCTWNIKTKRCESKQ